MEGIMSPHVGLPSGFTGESLPYKSLTNQTIFQVKRSSGFHLRTSRSLKCQAQGWFDFSTAGTDGQNKGKLNPGDFAVVSRLQQLGCGDLKRRPREVHFSGCINESYAFHCTGGDYFVKINRNFRSAEMFDGEAEALRQMGTTNTIRVPLPLAQGDLPEGGSFIIMEYLPIRPFGMMQNTSQASLGNALARLHLASSNSPNFGFSTGTRLGIMALDNTWTSSWGDFFVKRRLNDRLDRAFERLGEDSKELRIESSNLLERASKLLEGVEVRPSILHGDLWVGNAGLLRTGEVAIFDPATFIGHSEFDLAFQSWLPYSDFPGFSKEFYTEYHTLIPRSPGFEERQSLYQLFHLLNHYLIYGTEYYEHVTTLMRKLMGVPGKTRDL